MNKLYRSTAVAVLLAFISGCATQASNVAATYVPQSRYATANCEQLARDLADAQAAEVALSARQDSAASKDAGLVAVSLILFWPAAFFVGHDRANEGELARVKGEHQAIRRTFTEKGCK